MNQRLVSKDATANDRRRHRAAVATAWVSGAFCALVALLLLINAARARATDPLNTAKLDGMALALNRTPTDEKLRAELRKADLEVRGNFERSRRFSIDGIYLLLGGLAVCLAALEAASRWKPEVPAPDPQAPLRIWSPGPQSRRSVATLGLLMAGLLATAAVLSRHDAEAEYARAARESKAKEAAEPASSGGAGGEPGGVGIQPAGPGSGLQPVNPALAGPIQPTGSSLSPGGTSFASVPPGGSLSAVKGGAPAPTVSIEALYPAAWAQAWPGFRGPGGVGIASAQEAPTGWSASKNVIWKTPIDLPGWNSPIVWGDKVFLTGADKTLRKVYCIGATDGKVVWEKPAPSSTQEPPRVLEDTGYAPSTVATDGARVYAIFPNGDVFGFDFEGKQLWRRELGVPTNMYGHASSLVVYGNGLVVQFDQGTSSDDGKSVLYALNVENGQTVWQVKRPVGGSWTTPILIKAGSVEQLVTAANPWVISYNPANGTEIWRAECLSGDCAPSPVFGSGFVFAVNMGATMTALRPDMKGDITKTGIGWTAIEDLPDIVSPLCVDGLLYMVTTEGVLTCLDARTGKKQWDKNYNTKFNASPVFASGRIYVIENSGKAHILEPGRKFKELGTASIGEEVHATPAFVGGRIYMRGKSHLFCIGAQ